MNCKQSWIAACMLAAALGTAPIAQANYDVSPDLWISTYAGENDCAGVFGNGAACEAPVYDAEGDATGDFSALIAKLGINDDGSWFIDEIGNPYAALGLTANMFNITYDDPATRSSGTWELTGLYPGSPVVVMYVAKGGASGGPAGIAANGGGFNLFRNISPFDEGNWSVPGGFGLSHLSLYNGEAPPPDPRIPEPGTLALLAAGLLGLGVAARRRRA